MDNNPVPEDVDYVEPAGGVVPEPVHDDEDDQIQYAEFTDFADADDDGVPDTDDYDFDAEEGD